MQLGQWATYLKRWGFSPQKPKKKAYEQNSKAVQKWLKEEYPKIMKLAKKGNAELNPDEYLNNDLKSRIGLKQSPKNEKQMK